MMKKFSLITTTLCLLFFVAVNANADGGNLLSLTTASPGSWDRYGSGGTASYSDGQATFSRNNQTNVDDQWCSMRWITFNTVESVGTENTYTFSFDVVSTKDVTLRHVKVEKSGDGNISLFDVGGFELKAGEKRTFTYSGIPNGSMGTVVNIAIEMGGTDALTLTVDNFFLGSNIPDNDGQGIDWNPSTGTTCYVDKVEWVKIEGRTAQTSDNTWTKAHDGSNLTHYTISNDDLDASNTQHAQMLVKLKKKIKVSDVEIVWSNGYAKSYDVYAFESNPVSGGAIASSLLTDDNKLFSISDKILDYEPYFEVQSELQDKVSHEAEYILIDMTARGNMGPFGYFFDEIHVGAYDESYGTPHHLGMDDVVTVTDTDEELNITVRNKRGSILSDYTSQIDEQTISTSWDSPLLKKRDNHETTVYATSQGDYIVNINGELKDGTVLTEGNGLFTVGKNWKDASTWKSLVQQVYEAKGSAAGNYIKASRNQDQYTAVRAADGIEVDAAGESRWSSFSNNDGSNIPWDGSAAAYERRRLNNLNQYWMIDFEKPYEITNIEMVWERAYAPEYTVYGFETMPSDLDNTSYAEFKANHTANIIYEGVNNEASIRRFPLHDEHSGNSINGPIAEDNRTRYLVVKMNEPASQDGDYYGFSLWEVYAWGSDLEITDQVNALKTDNISIKAGYESSISVTAYNSADPDNTAKQEENWFPVEFSVLEPGYFVIPPAGGEVIDPSTGKKLRTYNIYKASSVDDPNKVLVAQIVDNDNGTYGIKAGMLGSGQTKDVYDDGVTDGSANDKSFTIQMTSTNTRNETITGTFEMVVYKEKMKAVTSESSETDRDKFGVSTDNRRVYDDGYFDASVLSEAANVSATLTQVDLRNVDFTTDNDGTSLATVELPKPSSINTNGVQMNPNAIYYVPGTGEGASYIRGENVAFTRGEVYYIRDMRIYDGWDYQPLSDKGIVALHARYSTNIPKDRRSLIVMPFLPRTNEINRAGKEVTFEQIGTFDPSDMTISLSPYTDFQSSDFPGHPFMVSTESSTLFSKTGYALTFHNAGYVGKDSDANQEVSIKASIDEVDLGGGATLKGTYTQKTLDNAGGNLWLFSSGDELFKPADDDSFNYDTAGGGTGGSKTHQGQDLRNTVLPFYFYLEYNGASSAKRTVSFVDGSITGIKSVEAEEQGADNEAKAVYDVQGRKVADNPAVQSQLRKGIYVVNGKKIIIK